MVAADLPELIRAMLCPGFYPHPVQAPIECLQTHISYVLLTGEFAYKVKKPANFGFLDFTDLAARRHYCQEELRLNQRGAPQLYLEVIPLTRVGNTYYLGGSGEVVEYTLKMRQFPQDCLLSVGFAQGWLQESHLEQLGRTVAAYHAQSPRSPAIDQFGSVAQVRLAIDENYRQTQAYVGGPQTEAQYQATKAYSDAFFDKEQALFQRRIEQGFIRENHGDLHLANICLWQEKLLLFDCIEFNESFRYVDCQYDVAFTVMDLEARGAKALANAFLNTYLEASGDWEGLQVLHLYLSRQAYVRAKVTSFLLDDPAIPEETRHQAFQQAAHYYQLAWQYTQPRPGWLMITCGLSGAGKTTTARTIARQTGAIHLRSDAVRKHLGGIPLQERGGPELYTSAMTDRTYQKLLELGRLLVGWGFPVILDAKYDRRSQRRAVIEQAKALGIPLEILHCQAPLEVLKQRIAQRQGDIADATVEVLLNQTFEELTPEELALTREFSLPALN